jgi:type I restriction enzyme S subunit
MEAVSTRVVDGVHKKPTYVDEGVPFVTVKNLTAGPGISFESLHYITAEDHAEFVKRAHPEPGDILVSKDGTLGVIRQVRTSRDFSIFVSVALVKPVLRDTSDYLEVALSSPTMQRQMVPKGSGLQHIHLEDLRADCVPLAPQAEQDRIVEAAARLLALAEHTLVGVDKQMRRVQRLRQAVLKWAFEGKLVDQDSADEPANKLLARISAERSAAGPIKKTRGRKAKAAS